MPAPALITHYGPFAEPLVTRESWRRRWDGLDELRADIVSSVETPYAPGGTYRNFEIKDCDTVVNGDVFEHALRCLGIKGGKSERRLIYNRTPNLEGFDDGTVVYLTTNQNKFQLGARMEGASGMVCVAAPTEQIEGSSWYRVTGQFRGIIGAKQIKRTVSTNGEITSHESLIVNFTGGWATAQKSQIVWPKVTCTYNFVTASRPTRLLPQQGGSPPAALPPTINIAVSDNVATWNWPNGWRMISFTSEEIPGTTICLNTEVWEFCQKLTL